MAKFKPIGRKVGTKSPHKTVLIVCEGARTEPDYFESFRLSKVVMLSQGKGYDEVWCVFDRDSFPRTNVTAAFKLMKQEKFNAAFSNEAFELWYLLHFQYLDTENTRAQYCEMLSRALGQKYEKNNPGMYELLLSRQDKAIQYAKKLDKLMPLTAGNEADCKPTTSVYKLVERLNQLAKKYEVR